MLHTLTTLFNPALAFAAFREASAGGGTPPQWTEGSDDPSTWHSPSDAAGGLILWDAHGDLERVEPPRDNGGEVAYKALADLAADGLADEAVPGIIRAAYFSSGGRAVVLVENQRKWVVAVLRTGRGDDEPREGASEEGIRRVDTGATTEIVHDTREENL